MSEWYFLHSIVLGDRPTALLFETLCERASYGRRYRSVAQIAKLRRQLKVILVDVSQDTDQLQIKLIASLIEPGQSFILNTG